MLNEQELLNDSLEVVEIDVQSIPKSIYTNSNREERMLGSIRNKLRMNKFAHKDFNAFLGSKGGRKYFRGIYNIKNSRDFSNNINNS
jgi:hypothetical protein